MTGLSKSFQFVITPKKESIVSRILAKPSIQHQTKQKNLTEADRMKCLVTGAGGFLGQYVVEKLIARGDTVRGLARGKYPQLKEKGVECIQADIQDKSAVKKACEGVDIVFHTAAIAGIWGKWEDFYGINTLGTDNVIAGCRAANVPKLVYSSSPSVTFNGSEQCGVDESAPYAHNWLCHYPHSKALAEKSVLSANSSELLTCALRPHLIWGPRDHHLVPRLIDRARSGKLRVVGDGTNKIDTVYVENAADSHIQAADCLEPGAKICGKAYFISQGEPVNCWDWINEILKAVKIAPVTKSISFRAAWNVGSVFEFIYKVIGIHSEPRMTRFLAAQLATSHYFDISAAKRDFGYSPRISNEEGMRRLVNSLSSG